jgi:hypothetical protein
MHFKKLSVTFAVDYAPIGGALAATPAAVHEAVHYTADFPR